MHEPHFGYTRHGMAVHLRTRDHLPGGNVITRFNSWLAVLVTKAVGTMYCAYVFALFDLLALPTALRQGLYGIVQWVASFFLQLVLLSVIMVGQNMQSMASDARAAKTFEDTETIADRLDVHTQGGIKDVLDALTELRSHVVTNKAAP
jgi:hypothetical protein